MTAILANEIVSLPDSLIGRLFYHAEINPDHDAVVTPALKLSYSQLRRLVNVQSSKFYENGITRHSVIGVKCANDTQHLILCLAATYIGATSCTIPTHESEHTQNAVIRSCGVTNIVDENSVVDLTAEYSDIETFLNETPIACLLFSTSGTTGDAKLVIHQDKDLVAQAHRHVDSGQERFVCLASIEHNFAKRHRLYCIAEGATNVFLGTDRNSLVNQCQSLNVNVMHLSAFQAQELLAIPNIKQLSNIRLKLGGSHVPGALRQQLRKHITKNLQAGYGTTETGAIAFTDPNDLKAGESVGQPLPGIELRIVSPDRKMLGNGVHGEIAIRSEGMFREYLGNPVETEARLENGWFYTGDIGYIDKQKRIHLSGRCDDMFVFNSMNIYPQEIESYIREHPDITDVVVLPKMSSLHGHIPVALITFAKNIKPDLPELKKFVKQQLGIRSPRQFIIVDEIPRNASGKISRLEAVSLTKKSENVRKSIIDTLGEQATNHMKPSLITALIKGDKDIKLRKFKLDSLARMELLIALELEYDVVISPQEFAQFRYLGNLVARVLSTHSQDEKMQATFSHITNTTTKTSHLNVQHYIVRLFQRTFSYCHTVAELNKALITLEHRLTPVELEVLYEINLSRQLISSRTAEKFHIALDNWLQKMKSMMMDSGKNNPELYDSYRISPYVKHFVGPGSTTDKTLLICFSEAGAHGLGMPNAVLLQHIDSSRYDILIISEPLNENYRKGVPHLGKNVTEVITWIAKQNFISNYKRLRTMGSSAGSYPALIAGNVLGAELVVSIGGRFYTKSHPIKSLERVFMSWKTMRNRNCSHVLMCYAKDESRDHHYAKYMAMLSGGSLMAVEFTNGNVDHLFLRQLVEYGELDSFLSRTIFADVNGADYRSKAPATFLSTLNT